MFDLIPFAIPFLFIGGGFVIGSIVEGRHMRSLDRREAQFEHILVTNLKAPPMEGKVTQAAYVDGQAVIGSDYFKTFAMQLRNFFGGELRGLQTLMTRARREAIVRMLYKADLMGATVVCNIRVETSTIGRGKGKRGIPSAEIHAYGTAVQLDHST